jgi:hypothetical protein
MQAQQPVARVKQLVGQMSTAVIAVYMLHGCLSPVAAHSRHSAHAACAMARACLTYCHQTWLAQLLLACKQTAPQQTVHLQRPLHPSAYMPGWLMRA